MDENYDEREVDYENMLYNGVVDYEQLYNRVNSLAREVQTSSTEKLRCGEVMAIYRMFVRLDTLSVDHLQEPELVKRLVVVADVIEIEGTKPFRLPGSTLVVILCRRLHIKNPEVVITLSMDLSVSNVTTAPTPRCSIRAQQIVSSSPGTLLIQVEHAIKWSDGSPFTQYFGRKLSYSPNSESSFIVSNDSTTLTGNGSVPPSSNLILVNSPKMNLLINHVRWKGHVDVQVALPSLDDVARPDVVMGIESNLLIVELILNFQTNDVDLVTAAREHAEWIDKSLLEVVHLPTADQEGLAELKALLARVHMLLKLPIGGRESLVVPLLQYGQYEAVISQMVRVAELYNAEFIQLSLFIQAQEFADDRVLRQHKLLAERERDVAALESAILARKNEELREALRSIDVLEGQLENQSRLMEAAKERMEQELEAYRNRQIAAAFFAGLGALFQVVGTLGLSGVDRIIGFGGSIFAAIDAAREVQDAVASGQLLDFANKIVDVEKVIQVVNAIKDLTDNDAEIEELLNAPTMPTIASYEWDMMENNVEEVAEGMPSDVSAVITWKTTCKNVVAVCREICTTAVTISELLFELFVHSKQQDIAQRHADRLETMQAVNLGDHLEMATQADMRTVRLLISLLNMLAVQNGAFNYQYLVPPDPFTAWPTVDSVRRHLVDREIRAVIYRERLRTPVSLRHEYVTEAIPVSLLLSGEDWSFTFDPSVANDSVFPATWWYVRIRYVEMKFSGEHKPNTPNGEVYLLLQSSSEFQDRSFFNSDEEVFHYEATSSLFYQYAYNLQTGDTTLPNLPHEEGTYLRMTPFTRWRLRLSASAYQNQGISFPTATSNSSSTQISISFYITLIARIQTTLQQEQEEVLDQRPHTAL